METDERGFPVAGRGRHSMPVVDENPSAISPNRPPPGSDTQADRVETGDVRLAPTFIHRHDSVPASRSGAQRSVGGVAPEGDVWLRIAFVALPDGRNGQQRCPAWCHVRTAVIRSANPTRLRTRRRLYASAVRLNSPRTFSSPRIRNAPWFIHCLIEPNGCSTVSRR
jgi:hypothetical protein